MPLDPHGGAWHAALALDMPSGRHPFDTGRMPSSDGRIKSHAGGGPSMRPWMNPATMNSYHRKIRGIAWLGSMLPRAMSGPQLAGSSQSISPGLPEVSRRHFDPAALGHGGDVDVPRLAVTDSAPSGV